MNDRNINAWLTQDELDSLNRISPIRVVGGIVATWLAVFAILQVAIYVPSPYAWALCFIAMGCVQNRLVSWNHEASHYNLTRNRGLNDLIADMSVSGSLGLAVRQYRWQHLRHHRYLGDPDREIDLAAWVCLRGGTLFTEVLRHLGGDSLLRILRRYRMLGEARAEQEMPRRTFTSCVGFVIWNAGVFALCASQGYWYLYFLLWGLPLFAVGMLIVNLRTAVEHQPSSDVCDVGLVKVPAVTRCVRAGFLERFLIAPVGFHYHHEHHLTPGIPFHKLPELRRTLQSRGYYDRRVFEWVDGYVNTIWQLSSNPGFGISVAPPDAGPASGR